jgi:hypothetical protein
VSIRYEGADAWSLSFATTTGGADIGNCVVQDGQFALEMWYDECFYVEGSKQDLLDMLDRARAVVESLPEAGTQRVEKRVRDLKKGDLFRFPDDEDFSRLTKDPEPVEGDPEAVYLTEAGRPRLDFYTNDIVFVIEEINTIEAKG